MFPNMLDRKDSQFYFEPDSLALKEFCLRAKELISSFPRP